MTNAIAFNVPVRCVIHISICLHVWWKLKKIDTHVEFHLLLIVDVQLFVRVDRHKQCADVGLKQ